MQIERKSAGYQRARGSGGHAMNKGAQLYMGTDGNFWW